MTGLRALMLALAASGCALGGGQGTWVKAGADEAQGASDLDACRKYARAEVKVQADIDQDIAASSSDPYGASMSGAVDFSAAGTEQRYRKIIDQCMIELGYGRGP